VSTALITGATGFLGSHVAAALHQSGHDVRVLVRRTSNLSRLSAIPVEVVLGDVSDRRSVRQAIDGVDVVVHAAAHLEFGPADPTFMQRVNVEGASIVLGEAASAGAFTVHVSSVAAYGHTDDEVRDETWWAPEVSGVHYERTKREAHEIARRLISEGASLTIVAPGGIYGHGDVSDFDSLVRAYSYFPIPMGYLPGIVQSFVPVDDCADGIVRIIEQHRARDEFILCADTADIAGVIRLIVESAGRKPPRYYLPGSVAERWLPLGDRLGSLVGLNPRQVLEIGTIAVRSLAFSGDKARRELAWSPQPLTDGIRQYVHELLIEREAFRALGLPPAI